jgi:sterol desaturase/sphingolipid hydroxylase (fatty acid hydroxylase superfamily)
MPEFFLPHEPVVRLAAFASVLIGMAAWELLSPRREFPVGRLRRWPNNFAIVVLDTLLVRLAFPLTAVGLALLAETRGWGLFNVLPVPGWLAIPFAVILLDLAIYLQHVVFHAVPLLWRLHRVHHADLGFDMTTGVRFHPFEIALSLAIKLAVVLALGAPAAAVLLFEILLNATSLFNHGNVRLPGALDRVLRWIVVTPDMHRVHHSARGEETNSNFGFNLPWWDRAFRTYRAQPRDGHDGMTIGLAEFRDPGELRLDRMLLQPFRSSQAPDALRPHEERI